MIKKNVTVKLNPNSITQLKELASLEGESQSKIIKHALDLYEKSKNDHKRRYMNIYHAVGEAEQMLEIKQQH